MKSRVVQNQFKSIINSGYERIETESGTLVNFSPMIKEIINAQAPEIIFTDWVILKSGEWTVNAEHEESKRKLAVVGRNINDCINKAKDQFI